jgi:hypothetical protein
MAAREGTTYNLVDGPYRNRSIEENLAFEGMKMEILKKSHVCVLKLIYD